MMRTNGNDLQPQVGLSLQGVSHAYSEELVIKRIDFMFPPGSLVAILGPSGCGKTTLLKICAGLIKPTGGVVTIGGISPREARKKGIVGFAFQSPTLLPWRTALENVLLPLELIHKHVHIQARERANELLDLVGLEDKMHAYPRELSGGQMQRVGLARALVTDPSALFLDEPFGQLDPKTRDKLNETVRQIWQKYSLNMLFVTHSVEEAVFVADYVVVLSKQPATVTETIEVPLGPVREHRIKGDENWPKLVRKVDDVLEGVAV